MTRYGSAQEARNDLADAKRRGETFDEWFTAWLDWQVCEPSFTASPHSTHWHPLYSVRPGRTTTLSVLRLEQRPSDQPAVDRWDGFNVPDTHIGSESFSAWESRMRDHWREAWDKVDSPGSAFAIYVADKLRRGWAVEQVAASIGSGIDPEALAVQIKRWGARGKVAA